MNKKIKVVSSVALAGLLAINAISPKALAADSKLNAVYERLVSNKKLASYIVVNKSDSIKVSDINADFKVTSFNGTAVSSLDTVVKTGDEFVANGSKYTVVVYGDVNNDGKISSRDALKVLQYKAKKLPTGVEMTDVDLVAANVNNKKGSNADTVNSADALQILKFATGKADSITVEKPEPEASIASNYTITVGKDGDGIVNLDGVKDGVDITVALKEGLEKELKNVYVTVENATTPVKEVTVSGAAPTVDAKFDIPAYTTKVEPKRSTDSAVKMHIALVTKEATLDENGDPIYSLENGEHTGKLRDADGNVLGEFKFTVDTTVPEASSVKVRRDGTQNAYLTLEGVADKEVAKVIYMYEKANTVYASGKAPKYDANQEKFLYTVGSTESKITPKTVAISGNKATDTSIATDLSTGAYRLYYVLENANGNRSEIANVMIALEGVSEKMEEPSSIVYNGKGIYTVTAVTSTREKTTDTYSNADGIVAELYKDGKIVSSSPVLGTPAVTEATDELSKTTVVDVDFSKDMKEAGEYELKVYVKGTTDGKYLDSEVTTSKQTLTALSPVTDLKFENGKLTWATPYTKDVEYVLAYQEYDTDNDKWKTKTPVTPNIAVSTKEYTFGAGVLKNNTIYRAIMTVQSTKNDKTITASPETTVEFLKLNTADIKIGAEAVSSNKVEIDVLESTLFGNNNISYDVEVDIANLNDDGKDFSSDGKLAKYTEATALKKTGLVAENDKDNKNRYYITVDNLTPGTAYAFIVTAKVKGVEGKTDVLPASKYVVTAPEIDALTKVDTKPESGDNTKYIMLTTDSYIDINGTMVATADLTTYYSKEYKNLENIVKAMAENDKITLADEKATIELNEKTDTRNFGATLRSLDVTFKGDKVQKDVIANNVKSATITGEGAVLNVSGITIETPSEGEKGEIVIENGVAKVITAANQKVTVKAGTEVSIDDIIVKPSVDTVFATNGKTLTVTVDGTVENTLEVSNTSSADITVVVNGKKANSAETLAGTLTLKAKEGKVTISSDASKANSTATINVIAEKDVTDIDLTDKAYSGAKSVTVKEDYKGTIKAYATDMTTDQEKLLKNATFELKAYKTGNREDNVALYKALHRADILQELGKTSASEADQKTAIDGYKVSDAQCSTAANDWDVISSYLSSQFGEAYGKDNAGMGVTVKFGATKDAAIEVSFANADWDDTDAEQVVISNLR